MCSIRKKSYFEPGFTMIELIMVIAILAILAITVAVSTVPTRLGGVANKLMYDLRYAQQLAISQQVSCGISFNPSANSYFVYIGDTATVATNPHTGEEFTVDYSGDSKYAGMDLVSTNFGDLIYFNPIGTPYDNSSTALSSQGIITLQYGSSTQTVVIEPGTGEVKLP